MDKATQVFNKYGQMRWLTRALEYGKGLLRGGKKELGKSVGYIKKEMKGEIQPLTTAKKTQISNMKDFTKVRGPIDSGRMQTQLEQHLNKTLWTGGKRPVSVMSKEQLAESVAREKYLRKMGL